MSESWTFNPIKPRKIIDFKEFEKSKEGRKAVADIESTQIGSRLVQFARYINPAIAFEEDLPFYSFYVPFENNLETWRTSDVEVFEDGKPLIIFDKSDDLDDVIMPYVLAGQLFRLAQDRYDTQNRKIVPMFQCNTVFNPSATLVEEKIFIKEYQAMQRASDVVALTILLEMNQNGRNKGLFGLMLQQKPTKDICKWMSQTKAYSDASGLTKNNPDLAHNLLLFMGDLAAMQSAEYKKLHSGPAEQTFKDTMLNPGFASLPAQLEIPDQLPFNGMHYSIISDRYRAYQWDPHKWIEAVNGFVQKEKAANKDRVMAAFDLANKRIESGDAAKDVDRKHMKKPKGPKK